MTTPPNPESGQTLEVELRGFLTATDFQLRCRWLRETAADFEEDHRRTVFFIIPGSTLKVAELKSKHTAKITLKSGDLVRAHAQRELEIPIAFGSVDAAVDLFRSLGFDNIQETEQLRYNGTVDGVAVSFKWSKDWGYHFEAEILVLNDIDVPNARTRLVEFCRQVGLDPVSENDFETFRQTVDARHKESSEHS